MHQNDGLRNKADNARVETFFLKIDEVDTDVLGCFFDAFGENSGQSEGYFGMLREQISEIRPGKSENGGGLHCRHAGGTWTPGQQGHFADCGSLTKLSHEKIDAGRRILFSNFHQPGPDDVHRDPGGSFAHDDFGWGEFDGLKAASQFCEAFRTEFREQFHVLQKLNQLSGIRCRYRHFARLLPGNRIVPR